MSDSLYSTGPEGESLTRIMLKLPSGAATIGYRLPLEEHPLPGAAEVSLQRGPAQGHYICPAVSDDVVRCLDEDVESSSNGQQARQALEISVGICESHRRGGQVVHLPNTERTLSILEGILQWTFEAQARI